MTYEEMKNKHVEFVVLKRDVNDFSILRLSAIDQNYLVGWKYEVLESKRYPTFVKI